MPMDFSTVHLVSTYQQFFSLSFFRLVRVLVSTMDPLSFNKAPQMGWTIWHELASFSNHDLKHFMLPRIDPCATHKLIFLYSPTAFSLSFLPCGPFPNMHAPSLFFTFHLIPSFSSGRLSLCLLLFNHPHNPSSLPIIKSLTKSKTILYFNGNCLKLLLWLPHSDKSQVPCTHSSRRTHKSGVGDDSYSAIIIWGSLPSKSMNPLHPNLVHLLLLLSSILSCPWWKQQVLSLSPSLPYPSSSNLKVVKWQIGYKVKHPLPDSQAIPIGKQNSWTLLLHVKLVELSGSLHNQHSWFIWSIHLGGTM